MFSHLIVLTSWPSTSHDNHLVSLTSWPSNHDHDMFSHHPPSSFTVLLSLLWSLHYLPIRKSVCVPPAPCLHWHAAYLPSHYITVTQFQYILTIFLLHGNLRQTKQALIYINIHISQRGWVLINISYTLTKV